MAIGEKIISVFSAPAEAEGFGVQYFAPEEKTHILKYDDKTLALHRLYARVREIRDDGKNMDGLLPVFNSLKENYNEEWLLPVEIIEIIRYNKINGGLGKRIITHLEKLKKENPHLKNLIENGISLA